MSRRLQVTLVVLTVMVLSLASVSHWRVRSFIFSVAIDIPYATYAVELKQNVLVMMSDGVALKADIYVPLGAQEPPSILMRTPYGKSSPSTEPFAMALARRGYTVIAQDVRGTGVSGGVFTPLINERKDGIETVRWIETQPWFNGTLGLFGLSYIGFTANAIAVQNPTSVKAVFAAVTSRGFYDLFYGSGGFNLEAALSWAVIMHRLKVTGETGPSLFERLLPGSRSDPIPFDTLPIAEADRAVTGEAIDFYRTFVAETDRDAAFWRASSLAPSEIAGIKVPVYLATAWYDTTLPQVLENYQSLRSVGQAPRLVIGGGPHVDTAAIFRYIKHSIAWFDHHLKNAPLSLAEAHVSFFRMGDEVWLDTDEWPVPAKPRVFYLNTEDALGQRRPAGPVGSTRYVFNPQDPTPALGGPLLMSTEPVVDNWPLEQRSDTLTFTTPAFENAVDIIGVPNAGIFVESDVETFDVFVRINRVDRDGRSTNITDGVRRIPSRAMKNNVERVRFDLSPTAIRLQEGERLRVLIASGAHPRIARNLGQGTLAEQAWATEMQTANVFIHHNGVYPSNVSIPLADAASIAANPQH